MPIARLRVMGGAEAGRQFNIEQDGMFVIGRSAEADLQISDPMASRRHCAITLRGSKAYLEDLDSTNGTILNGRPASKESLNSGDVITIGATDIEFMRVISAPSVRKGGPPAAGKQEDATAPIRTAGKGKVIGGYKILERLGVGGMGTVYKALQMSMNRVVAFKVLNITSQDTERAIKEFLREAQTGAALNHPNIVTFYDQGRDKGLYYIAMELIEGVPLDKILEERGPMDVGLALDIIIQVTDALCFMFSKGIIHRDLKPSNIMLTPQRIAKLTDFGLAKSFVQAGLTGYTRVGEGKGTLEYMPPEQIDNALYCDQRADIYSLGATLYDMLTGRPPFMGESMRELLDQIERKYPPPLKRFNPNVPDYVSAIVEKCMRKKPEERYQFPDELLKALKSAFQRLSAGRER